MDHNFGESGADFFETIGEVFTICIQNVVILVAALMIMKCLLMKKDIESNKILNWFKSKVEGTIQELQWTGFYMLFIEGYKDLLIEIIKGSE